MKKIISMLFGFSYLLLLSLSPVQADPITFFSKSTAYVQAESTGFSTAPTYYESVASPTGAQVTAHRDVSVPEGDASGTATADLAAGELKVMANATASGDGGYFYPFVRADIGDSFQTFDSNGPFVWQNDTMVHFTLDVSGAIDELGADNDTELVLTILAPGTLDAYYQWAVNDGDFNDWIGGRITYFDYWLGPDNPGYSFITETYTTFPQSIEASFEPGGDFDWVISLLSFGSINGDFAPLNAYYSSDFYNTLTASYNGPEGTTTYSASGQFPGTESLNPVPEPATMLLLGTGLVGVAGAARRKRKNQA